MNIPLSTPLGILLGCFIALSWFAGSDAPYVPSKMEKVKRALKLSGLRRGQNFYELGSGDGRVVYEAAIMGARAFGIEQSILRVIWSKIQARLQKLPNAKFIHGNIFQKDLSEADVVFIYLLHKGVAKLEGKLQKELKKESLVITQKYHFPNWKPVKKDGDLWLYKV